LDGLKPGLPAARLRRIVLELRAGVELADSHLLLWRSNVAGLQFVIAYEQVDGSQMFARMLLIAVAEAGLALMFFMHLGQEKRGLLLFVTVFTIFVIAAMQ
jgi:cytochrome c oxidase subunit IV